MTCKSANCELVYVSKKVCCYNFTTGELIPGAIIYFKTRSYKILGSVNHLFKNLIKTTAFFDMSKVEEIENKNKTCRQHE